MSSASPRSGAAERIGEKVRHLRLSRGLTQKELAGDKISRNMLSMIESGAALPSIETLFYISEVLSVPTGYFFAVGDEEMLYGKREALKTVYQLMDEKKFSEAAELCKPYAENDGEMCLYFSLCHLNCAVDLLKKSMLTSAQVHLSTTAEAAAGIPLDGGYIADICNFIRTLSDSVSQDTIPDVLLNAGAAIPASFTAYLAAYKALKEGDPDCAAGIARSGLLGRFHSLHIRGAVLMASGDYSSATRLFDLALSSDDGGFWSRYKLVCDLEICRKNSGDFEAAYALSTSRMEMLGMFSK